MTAIERTPPVFGRLVGQDDAVATCLPLGAALARDRRPALVAPRLARGVS